MNHPHERTAEDVMILDYMDDVKDKALSKLSKLEIAALFNDFDEFRAEMRDESDRQLENTYLD